MFFILMHAIWCFNSFQDIFQMLVVIFRMLVFYMFERCEVKFLLEDKCQEAETE